MVFKVFSCVALMCLPNIVLAETISADRPGYSTGTSIVSAGHFNVELGMTSSFGNNVPKTITQTLPITNIRVGVTQDVELEIQWGGLSFANPGSNRTSGDIAVGGKYRLQAGDNYHLSTLGLLGLPTGSGTATSPTPLLGLLWDYSMAEGSTLFGVVQASANKVGAWQSNAQASLGLSHGYDDKLSTFIELFTDVHVNYTGGNTNMLDSGVSYLYTDQIQLDLSVGYSLDRKASDFIGLGVARRF